jgi:hypothetical protein
MAKRVAEKELTDRNWDEEDEVEEVQSRSLCLLLSVSQLMLLFLVKTMLELKNLQENTAGEVWFLVSCGCLLYCSNVFFVCEHAVLLVCVCH